MVPIGPAPAGPEVHSLMLRPLPTLARKDDRNKMATSQQILDALTGLERRLEEKIDSKFGELSLEMNARFDAQEVRFERLETEYHMIVAGLRRIEETLAEQKGEQSRMRDQIASLRTRLAEVETRLRELEARLPDA